MWPVLSLLCCNHRRAPSRRLNLSAHISARRVWPGWRSPRLKCKPCATDRTGALRRPCHLGDVRDEAPTPDTDQRGSPAHCTDLSVMNPSRMCVIRCKVRYPAQDLGTSRDHFDVGGEGRRPEQSGIVPVINTDMEIDKPAQSSSGKPVTLDIIG